MALKVRLAASADLPDVLRLYAQPGFDDGKVLPLDRAEAIFERMQSYPDYRLFVAELDGRIVGTFALLIMDNLGHQGAPSGILEDVAVDPAHQGRGIGREMVHHALEECRTKGCYKLALTSNLKRSRAHAFYEKLGLDRHGYSFLVQLHPADEEDRHPLSGPASVDSLT